MKFICIGKNYADHIAEFDACQSDEPLIFLKPDSALHPMGQPYYIPDFTQDLHYEVEVIVKISQNGKCVLPQFAHKYYQEIGLGIDFTARDLQQKFRETGQPWERCKSFDGSAVVGAFFPKQNWDSVQNIGFRLLKNGQTVQKSNTSQMLWKIDELIAKASEYFTLKKGDILFTGTPSGVGGVKSLDVLEGYLEDTLAFSLRVK